MPPGRPSAARSRPARSIRSTSTITRRRCPFRAITGGYVYRGPVAELQGKYFFADFSNASNLWSLASTARTRPSSTAPTSSSFTDWTQLLAPDVGAIGDISSFGEDAAGNLYVLDLGGVFVPTPGGGEIYRVVPEPASATLVGVALAALAARGGGLIRRREILRYCVIPPAGVRMRRTLLFALTLLLSAPADALILDSGDGQGNTTPPADDPGWAHVGRVTGPSGIYLGNGWVLTANHVTVSESRDRWRDLSGRSRDRSCSSRTRTPRSPTSRSFASIRARACRCCGSARRRPPTTPT